jgi:hypothetical protein
MAWLPMDTAPRDGTVVLIASDGEVSGGYWDDGLDEDGEFYHPASWWAFDAQECGPVEPVAWQPYPDFPKEKLG